MGHVYIVDSIVHAANLRGCSVWDSYVCGQVLRSGTNDNPRCHLHHVAAYPAIFKIPWICKSTQRVLSPQFITLEIVGSPPLPGMVAPGVQN